MCTMLISKQNVIVRCVCRFVLFLILSKSSLRVIVQDFLSLTLFHSFALGCDKETEEEKLEKVVEEGKITL